MEDMEYLEELKMRNVEVKKRNKTGKLEKAITKNIAFNQKCEVEKAEAAHWEKKKSEERQQQLHEK